MLKYICLISLILVIPANAGSTRLTLTHGGGGTTSGVTCPYGSGIADGCPSAPTANAYTTQNSTFFSGYANTTGQTYQSASFTGSISSGVLTISGVPANTAATASWTGGGSTPALSISIPSGLSGIAVGLTVYDTTTSSIIGTVTGYSGTTLSITPAQSSSSGSTDGIAFRVIAGHETIIGAGVTAGVFVSTFGTGTGGNGTYNLTNAGSISSSGSMNALRRPNWNVPGVDYPVGPRTNPSINVANGSTTLPGGGCVTYSGTEIDIACGSSNIAFNNWDFSQGGGYNVVVVSGTGTITFTDCYVKIGSASGATGFWLNVQSAANVVINYSTLDHNAQNYGSVANTLVAMLGGKLTLNYVAVLNSSGQVFGPSLGGMSMTDNYMEGLNYNNTAHGEWTIYRVAGTVQDVNISFNTFLTLPTFGAGATAPIYQSTGGANDTFTTVEFENNVFVDNFYQFTGYIVGTTMTITSITPSPSLTIYSGGCNTGLGVFGVGVTQATTIQSCGTANGAAGNYTINNSQTVFSSGSPGTLEYKPISAGAYEDNHDIGISTSLTITGNYVDDTGASAGQIFAQNIPVNGAGPCTATSGAPTNPACTVSGNIRLLTGSTIAGLND